MPDARLLILSVVCLVAAAVLILFPKAIEQLNELVNRTVVLTDKNLMRYRHVLGVVLFITAYLLFRLSLMPTGATP